MKLLFHDEGCGELVDHMGDCPMCKIPVELQSLEVREVSNEEIHQGLTKGRTFLGAYRTPICRRVEVLPIEDRPDQFEVNVQTPFRSFQVELPSKDAERFRDFLNHVFLAWLARVMELEEAIASLEEKLRTYEWESKRDKPLPEDALIDAAFPTRSERHDLYAQAMRLVGARYSKAGLVALVNWLLLRLDVAEEAQEDARCERLDAEARRNQ